MTEKSKKSDQSLGLKSSDRCLTICQVKPDEVHGSLKQVSLYGDLYNPFLSSPEEEDGDAT